MQSYSKQKGFSTTVFNALGIYVVYMLKRKAKVEARTQNRILKLLFFMVTLRVSQMMPTLKRHKQTAATTKRQQVNWMENGRANQQHLFSAGCDSTSRIKCKYLLPALNFH